MRRGGLAVVQLVPPGYMHTHTHTRVPPACFKFEVWVVWAVAQINITRQCGLSSQLMQDSFPSTVRDGKICPSVVRMRHHFRPVDFSFIDA